MRMLIIMYAMLISLPAMAVKPGGTPEASPPVVTVFTADPLKCNFIHLMGGVRFAISGIDPFLSIIVRTDSTTWGVDNGLSKEAADSMMLEMVIRYNGLSLTPEDFRDPTTSEFDCTNDKLFSLL